MPVYIEKVEIWSDVTIAGRTNNRTRKDRATQPNGPWTAEMSNNERQWLSKPKISWKVAWGLTWYWCGPSEEVIYLASVLEIGYSKTLQIV